MNVKILGSFGEGISGGAEKAALVVKKISITEESPVWHLDSKGALGAKPHPAEAALAKIQIHLKEEHLH